jgi:hypothetical protein
LAAAGFLLAPRVGRADDLSKIIPGLFGGNGITLATDLHAAHFSEESLAAFNQLGSGISSGINLANVGANAGSFTFDVQHAVFVRSTESLGPTLAERAETIGEGKLNVAWTYTRLDYARFSGQNLHNLNLVFQHEAVCTGDLQFTPPCPDHLGPPDTTEPFQKDNILVNMDVNLSQDQFLFYGKYGITPRWDVGLILPVIHSQMQVDATATIQRNDPTPGESRRDHNFCVLINGKRVDPGRFPALIPCAANAIVSSLNNSDVTTDGKRDEYTGFGDLVLRTKYNFFRGEEGWLPELSVLGGVRFNTGDGENFTGAGNTGFQGYIVASKKLGLFTPHFNWGTELTTDGNSTNIWRLITGSEFTPVKWITLSADILGQQSFNLNGVNAKLWDFGFGTKVNPFSTFTLLADFIVPLNNDNGLRTHVTWTVGFEYTFF